MVTRTQRPTIRAAIIAAALGGICAAPGVSAQQTFNLTAIDGYPARSMWVKEFSEFFIPEVDKRLAAAGKYKIRWNQAYGGQIVKPGGVLDGLKLGLGDIGVVTTPFHTDKVPLQGIAYMTPFTSSDPMLMAQTLDKLADQYPAMKGDFTAHGQVYLSTGVVLDSYQLFTKKPVKELVDLKGFKVNGAGTNLRYLSGVGVTGVAGSLPSYYNNLQTGIVDGALLWSEAAATFKIAEVAPFMLKADLGAVNSKVLSANADSWKKLPEDVRKAIQEAAYLYRDRLAKVAAGDADASLKKYQAAGGKVTEMPDSARLAWAKSMPNLATDWAKRMDAAGKPGSKILASYMDMMRAGGAKPLRNWDRE